MFVLNKAQMRLIGQKVCLNLGADVGHHLFLCKKSKKSTLMPTDAEINRLYEIYASKKRQMDRQDGVMV